jgi:hypothetical protein
MSTKITVTSILPCFSGAAVNPKALRRTMARMNTLGRRNARKVDAKAMKSVLAKKKPDTRTKAVLDFVGC